MTLVHRILLAIAIAVGVAMSAAAQYRDAYKFNDGIDELARDIGDKLSKIMQDRPGERLTVFVLTAKDGDLDTICGPLSRAVSNRFYNALQRRKDSAGLRSVTFTSRQEVEDGAFAISLKWFRAGQDRDDVSMVRMTAEMGEIRSQNVLRQEGSETLVGTGSLEQNRVCINYVQVGLVCPGADSTLYVLDSPTSTGLDVDQIKLGDRFRVAASFDNGNAILVSYGNNQRGFLFRSTSELQDWVSRRVCRGEIPEKLLPKTPNFEDWSAGRTLKRLCSDCPDFVVLEQGGFEMGSPRGESGRDDDEGPVTPVEIGYDIAVAATEVTLGQWNACVDAGACQPARSFHGSDDDLPVTVDWRQAKAYADWLSGLAEGDVVRLPSEAEWEYAARGGEDTRFPWGDVMEANAAICRNCGVEIAGRMQSPDRAFEVKSRDKPNAFGLHDMNGNLWEWVADCWSDRHSGSRMAGEVRDAGRPCRSEYRVIKGGSYADDNLTLRPANRNFAIESAIEPSIGFRVVRVRGGAS